MRAVIPCGLPAKKGASLRDLPANGDAAPILNLVQAVEPA
jgi:hypothetical protein